MVSFFVSIWTYICHMAVRPIVLIWLMLGLLMLYFQIIIGGVTRLTGSGLSITKWEIVTGTFPPMDEQTWNEEFDKYKQTPQYEKINVDMPLGDSIFESGSFKFIYFWEYFHRLWARSMGIVFLIPFLAFSYFKWLPSSLKRNLGIVVALAGLAATFGWIMVASGLVNRPWVNAYKLSIHLSIGISVFIFMLWTILNYVYHNLVVDYRIRICRSYTFRFLLLICVQIFFGGIMSGMKAALIFPTWPDIGGEWIPKSIFVLSNWTWNSFVHYDQTSFVFALMHFIHRSLAYVIVAVLVHYFWKYHIGRDRSEIFYSTVVFVGLLIVQIVLGIVTLIKSVGNIPVFLGVLHQGVAVLVLASFVMHYFFVRRVQ